MDVIIEFLKTLGELSPLAVIALLGTVIFLLVKGKTAADEKVETIATNHLHELPELVETMREMHRTLIALDSYLRAKLNGR